MTVICLFFSLKLLNIQYFFVLRVDSSRDWHIFYVYLLDLAIGWYQSIFEIYVYTTSTLNQLLYVNLYRQSATERARSFIYTPPVKPVNVHQFYATLVNEYEVQVSIPLVSSKRASRSLLVGSMWVSRLLVVSSIWVSRLLVVSSIWVSRLLVVSSIWVSRLLVVSNMWVSRLLLVGRMWV